MPQPLDVRWIHGSPDCVTNTDPPLQVHALDEGTYAIRQNKCLSYEAPFLYLLLGERRGVLLDTGAAPPPGKSLPVRDVVDRLVARWQARNGGTLIELVVAHSHGHADHAFGDRQFRGRPHTRIVPGGPAGAAEFFGLANWPEGSATFELGGRALTVLAAPGHEPSHIALYDEATRVVLSGDAFYPGFLYVGDWGAYRRSVARLRDFAERHPVDYFLGAHVEMTRTAGVAYPSGTTYQPDEHVLELTPAQLARLDEALESAGATAARIVLDDFIVEPPG
jgi:glyoxylase-like metal-dependent hydrolase (beta-lactamase superfamily II)